MKKWKKRGRTVDDGAFEFASGNLVGEEEGYRKTAVLDFWEAGIAVDYAENRSSQVEQSAASTPLPLVPGDHPPGDGTTRHGVRSSSNRPTRR